MGKAFPKKKLVGSIGIEVRPVLDGFRREVKRGVKAALAGLRPEVEVKADVDARQVRRDLNRAVRMAEKSVKDAQVGVDLSSHRKAWDQLVKDTRKSMVDVWEKDFLGDRPDGVSRGTWSRFLEHDKNLMRERTRLYQSWKPPMYTIDMEPDRGFFNQTRTMLDGFFQRAYVGKVRWELEEDSDRGWNSLQRRMENAFRNHDNYKFKVKAVPDIESGAVDKALNEIRNEFRRRAFTGRDFEIPVSADMDNGSLRKVGRQLRELKRKWDDTEIEFKLSLDHSARYIATARLAWLARDRFVKFRPVLDHKAARAVATALAALSGGRLMDDLARRWWDIVKNLDKATPMIGMVSSLITFAAAGAVQLAKHTYGVLGSFGHILQMVGLLGPGFLAAGGILMSAFIVPMFKAGDHIQDILDDWKAMADEMGASFWGSAMDDFRSAHERAFSVFNKDMADLSGAAGSHFGKLADSISRIVAPRFNEWVKHSSAGLEELASHSDAFATVIDILGRHGSMSLERFLGWWGKLTDQYANWLTDAESSGKLQMMIDRGIKSLRDLGRATKNLGTTLGGVFEVVRDTGGADMERFADGLQRWSDITHSRGFQSGLGNFLTGFTVAWQRIKDTSGRETREFLTSMTTAVRDSGALMGEAAGRMWGGVMQSLSGAKFNKGVFNFFDGLNDGLKRLSSTWPKVAGMFGDLMTVMGSMGRGFSPVVGSMLEGFALAADRLAGPLSRIVELAGPRMGRSIDLTARVVTPLLEALANLIELLARIPGLVEVMFAAFAGGKALASVFALGKALKGAFTGFKADLIVAGGLMASIFGGKKGAGAAGPIGSELSGGKIGLFAGNALSKAKGAVGGLRGALGGIVSMLGGPWMVALGAGAAALFGFYNGSVRRGEEAANSLRDALRAAAAEGERSGEQIASTFKTVFAGSRMDGARDFKNALGFMELPGMMQAVSRTLSSIMAPGDVTATVADSLKAAFEEISALAATSPVSAANALQSLKEGMRLAGAEADVFTTLMREQLDTNPVLAASLQNLAGYLGYTADEYGVMSMVASDVNFEFAMQEVAAERAAVSTETLTAALDNAVSSFGVTGDEAMRMTGMVRDMAPAFVDFSAAATDANGQVVASLQDLVENLEVQLDAHAAWADNIADLTARGVDQGVLENLSRAPGGAQFIAQLADLTGAEFERVVAVLEQGAGALDGSFDHMSQSFADLAAASDASFADLVASAETALAELEVVADLSGVNTVSQLVQALNENGVQVSAAGENLVFEFASGFGEPRDVTVGLGGDLVSGIAEGIEAGAGTVLAPVEGIKADIQAALSPDVSQTIGTDWGAGLSAGISSSVGDATGASDELATAVVDSTKSGLGVHSPSVISMQFGVDWDTGLALGIQSAASQPAGAMKTVVKMVYQAAAGQTGAFYSVGVSISRGIASGISAGSGAIQAAAASAVKSAVAAAKAAADINSPSKKMIPIGVGLSEGVEVGLQRGTRSLVDEAGAMVVAAMAAVQSYADRVGSRMVVPVSAPAVHVSTEIVPSEDDSPRTVSLVGSELVLKVGDHEFTGYVEDTAAGVVEEYEDARRR